MMRTASGDDSGFTLVELLLATTITGLLATVIAAAFAVGVKTTDTANDRLAGSQGAQIATSFFPSDMQSSTGAITLGGTPCTGAAPMIAQLRWTDVDAASVSVNKVAEYTCVVAGTRRHLIRRFTSGATVTDVVVAYDVTAASVSCLPDCTTATSARITATHTGGYVFSVTARRRSS